MSSTERRRMAVDRFIREAPESVTVRQPPSVPAYQADNADESSFVATARVDAITVNDVNELQPSMLGEHPVGQLGWLVTFYHNVVQLPKRDCAISFTRNGHVLKLRAVVVSPYDWSVEVRCRESE